MKNCNENEDKEKPESEPKEEEKPETETRAPRKCPPEEDVPRKAKRKSGKGLTEYVKEYKKALHNINFSNEDGIREFD
uniref:Uncharacterized protein n=1 Tax=Otolemur garnettii TaxID=30611 RepID=H0XQC8_OTOGA